MLLCPDCRGGLASVDVESCPACGWSPQRLGANYDRIAAADLMTPTAITAVARRG